MARNWRYQPFAYYDKDGTSPQREPTVVMVGAGAAGISGAFDDAHVSKVDEMAGGQHCCSRQGLRNIAHMVLLAERRICCSCLSAT